METLCPQYPADALAEALEVSESGFAAHGRKALRPRRQHDERLRVDIAQSFAHSRETYGCQRVRLDLQEQGQRCGKTRIARLMREAGLRPKQKRRFRPCTTESKHTQAVAENWLAKVPSPDRPGQVWQSDFTYVETAEGWLYLAFTLDACTRYCVAHHCRADMRGELTTTTLAQALERQPPAAGLLHHSDRGVQYAAAGFAQLATAHGLTLSMSRTGNPYDNALAESFVATLKTECFGQLIPPTHAAAKLQAFDYIETFYNPHRRHSSLGGRSPREFANQMFPPNITH
jgi:putative transposase